MGNSFITSLSGQAHICAAYALLLLPFFSFLLNGLWLGRKYPRASAWSATALMGGALIAALVLALGYRDEVLGHPGDFPSRTAMAWEHTWMRLGTGMEADCRLSMRQAKL